eukprot:Gb_22222 [translate_table: standard]
MIYLIEIDTHCLGGVYEGMDSMLEKITEIIKLEEKRERDLLQIKDIVVKSWNKMTTPLHTLVYANPKFYHEDSHSIPCRKAPNKDKEI